MDTQLMEYNWTSSNGMVNACLGYPADAECDIYKFDAVVKREGHGRRALEELRQKYSVIRAIDIGDETNDNRLFWMNMAKAGLVDELYDFDVGKVWPVA